MMTDEQYLDELIAKEGCDMGKTPGFRDMVLDMMGMLGERPRAGELHSMHMAYKAGLAYAKEHPDPAGQPDAALAQAS